jgi:tetratricopeptide (TPR) repeat protein
MKWIVTAVATGALCIATESGAQFRDRMGNPAIPVTLSHPASLGLQAKRVAFGPASGPCSDQVIDMLTEDFVQSGVEVMDRQHLDAVLAEHDFNMSAYVDRNGAAELGKILGPAALVFVRGQRCTHEKKSLYQDRQNYSREVVRVFISRTQFFFRGSVQTVDLATGRIFAATTVESSPSLQNESETGIPEFPSEFDLQDGALRQATGTIHRMFFPWSEQRNLIFFDDDDCNLKQAYQYIKAGDAEGALRSSLRNLEDCRARTDLKPKTLGHAYYNVGMSQYVIGDYEKAIGALREASRLRPGDVVAQAIALCSEASNSAAQMRRIEERMAVEAAATEQKEELKKADITAKQPKVLSIKEVVAMRSAGLSDDLIAAAIRKNNQPLDLGVEDMLELKRNGIADDLIKLMLDPNSTPTPAPPAPPAKTIKRPPH